jgi:hypothetical protein
MRFGGSHGGEDVGVGLLGCDVVLTCMSMPTFRRNILPPSSGLKMDLHVCACNILWLAHLIRISEFPGSNMGKVTSYTN